MRAFGLMSGTSGDGIDVADVLVVESGGRLRIELQHFTTAPFDATARERILAAQPPANIQMTALAALDVELGELLAEAALAAARDWGVDMRDVDVIGSHGHTIYHAPELGISLQIGRPTVIAARTGVTCVADFRGADVALGGQGAPLVPFVDLALLAAPDEYRAALNIGGIANLTLLPDDASGGAEAMSAFDTGPGNMVIDACVRDASDGENHFDRDGEMAARGSVAQELLDALLDDPYFKTAPPKSTGRERFGAAYAAEVRRRAGLIDLSPDDLVATITALTARSIAAQIPAACTRVIASGGGVHNRTLMSMLAGAMPQSTMLETSDAHGIPPDAKEAIAFAVLACEAVVGKNNHVASCTGARRPVVLGVIAPGMNYAELMRGVFAHPVAAG